MFDYEIKSSVSWYQRLGFILGIVAVCLLARVFVYHIQNPDLTEMRVLINMWPFVFSAILSGLIGGILYHHESE